MRRTNDQLANGVKLYKVELDRDESTLADERQISSMASAVKQ